MPAKNVKVNIYNSNGEIVGEASLNSQIFGLDVNYDLVHQAAVAQISNRRNVVSKTKDRSEVSGGGKKPWRQKGTGRARAGSTRSPLWKGGGVTFGPTNNRNFKKKINKKMKTKALFVCLSDRVAENNLILVDKYDLKQAKTKQFNLLLNKLMTSCLNSNLKGKKKDGVDGNQNLSKSGQVKKKTLKHKPDELSVLVVAAKDTAKLSRAGRNIPGVKVLGANCLNVVDILAAKYLLISRDCLPIVEDIYLKKNKIK